MAFLHTTKPSAWSRSILEQFSLSAQKVLTCIHNQQKKALFFFFYNTTGLIEYFARDS